MQQRSGSKFIVVILLVLLSFSSGYIFGAKSIPSIERIGGVINKEKEKPVGVDFSLFWDAWRLLEEQYVGEELDQRTLVHGAISGLVDSVGDPYTVFLNPEDTEKFEEDLRGSFEGIGAEIGIRDDTLTIISPIKGTPAERSGLRAGDKILEIDETSTFGLSLDEAVNLIRGPEGTTVALNILRGDTLEDTTVIEITRAVIEIPAMDWELIEGSIAHIEIYNFNMALEQEFPVALTDLLVEGADRIILDLRNNPGGLLGTSVEIAGYFLPKNTLVVSEDSKGDKSEHKTRQSSQAIDLPMVILVNQGSASASEILAGALRDHNGVQLVGQQTFGKGSVQILQKLKDNSTIKITVAEWLTPSGLSINKEGLRPDVEVEYTEEDFDEDRDPQLDKAIEIIKNL